MEKRRRGGLNGRGRRDTACGKSLRRVRGTQEHSPFGFRSGQAGMALPRLLEKIHWAEKKVALRGVGRGVFKLCGIKRERCIWNHCGSLGLNSPLLALGPVTA